MKVYSLIVLFNLGYPFVLEMVGAISSNDREWSAITYANSSNLNALPTIVSQLSWDGFVTEIMNKLPLRTDEETDFAFQAIREKFITLKPD